MNQSQCSLDEVLQLLRQLYLLFLPVASASSSTFVSAAAQQLHQLFHSKKITNKLVQQLQVDLSLLVNFIQLKDS